MIIYRIFVSKTLVFMDAIKNDKIKNKSKWFQ